jgi:hypothetical protein
MKDDCTWGFGPDVLLSLEGIRVFLLEAPFDFHCAFHGFVSQGQMDL